MIVWGACNLKKKWQQILSSLPQKEQNTQQVASQIWKKATANVIVFNHFWLQESQKTLRLKL